MIRSGAAGDQMRPFTPDDLWLLRLKLLLIMAKAYLKGYPLGDWRKQAVRENARYIFYHTFYIPSDPSAPCSAHATGMDDDAVRDHLFHQRVQLLAVMVNASADDKLLGRHRKKALADNINAVCQYLSEQMHLTDFLRLKVA